MVDTLGCAYVNVDHRYYNQNVGSPETDYTSINLQPGYQKLCYENALDYVRYRHTDSDFVRVARQQDFLRDLREQVAPSNELGQLDTVAKAVGHAITTTFHASASELIELAKLIAFSQGKPLRQVKFQSSNVDAVINGGSYVTSTPELEQATLEEFLGTATKKAKLRRRRRPAPRGLPPHATTTPTSSAPRARRPGAAPTRRERSRQSRARGPLPGALPGPADRRRRDQETSAPYALRDQHGHLHHAYVVVWRQNGIGGYYDFEGTDWLNPPLFAHARNAHDPRPRTYKLVDDGAHIHAIGWRQGNVLYWVTNTLLEDLSNAQMLAIAKSAQSLH